MKQESNKPGHRPGDIPAKRKAPSKSTKSLPPHILRMKRHAKARIEARRAGLPVPTTLSPVN